jgi:hypothetical protein
MDRLIWTAWRAFWVGLGASAVLIAQSLLAPAPAASTAPADSPASEVVAPIFARGAADSTSASEWRQLTTKSRARLPNAS